MHREYLVKLLVPLCGLEEIEVRGESPADAVAQLRDMFGENEITVASIHNAWEPRICLWRHGSPEPPRTNSEEETRMAKIWRRLRDG